MTHNCNSKVFKDVKSKEKVRIHTNFFLNMLHSLIIHSPLSIKAEMRKCLMFTNVI